MDIYKLKRMVYLSPLAKSRILQWYRFKSRIAYIKEIAKRYGREKDLDKLMPLIKKAYIKYRWNIEEFFMWDFEHLTQSEVLAYCPEFDHNIFVLTVNNFATAKLFRDKWSTYKRFAKYFKRACVYVENLADLQKKEVKQFLKDNSLYLAKPVGACCGRGIQKLSNESNEQLKNILLESNTGGGYLLESFIIQSPKMGVLHPASVNTIRIPTINYGDHIEIFHPYMRMGMNNSFVDNVASGGIAALIDPTTGIVMSSGDEFGNSYTVHPNTNEPIVGFKIPYWEDAITTVKQMASEVPDVHYVGWDLALTNQGWVMIEGNEDGQFGFQYIGPGVAEEVKQICKRLKKIQ